MAIASISNFAFLGRLDTSIYERAGRLFLKYLLYILFTEAKFFMSCRYIVTFTTSSKELPPASKIAFIFYYIYCKSYLFI